MAHRLHALLAVLLAYSPCDESTSQPPPPSTVVTSAPIARASAPPPLPHASASAAPIADPKPLHAQSQDELLALLPPYPKQAEPFLRRAIDVGGFGAMNQGNEALAKHTITRRQCLDGLKGITLQTPKQRKQCGHDNMVPIVEPGDTSKPYCIDIFEFPNKTCELPFVWSGASQANAVCKKLGKRLCTQREWSFACAADPAGGEPRKYAYGDELDLTICNTNKDAATHDEDGCDGKTVQSAWDTCATNTEPSGSFPRCRSRFGVFDQHGNVAEAMTRYDSEEGQTVSQLKGSAFFYVDVHRRLDQKPEKRTYPDHCMYDPRWHVEPMKRAWHVNYHLGFRCCTDVK
jgi:formylglycine-generating enzyme required for sulfatase activity